MKTRCLVSILSFVLLSALALGACSGYSPLGPSTPQGVVLEGSVLGLPGSDRALSASAPIDAQNFAGSMLNKLTLGTGGDATLGPYPEEGFQTGGRSALVEFFSGVDGVIDALAKDRSVYEPKLNSFDPQRFFNSSSPNRAADNWNRDYARLKQKALI